MQILSAPSHMSQHSLNQSIEESTLIMENMKDYFEIVSQSSMVKKGLKRQSRKDHSYSMKLKRSLKRIHSGEVDGDSAPVFDQDLDNKALTSMQLSEFNRMNSNSQQ